MSPGINFTFLLNLLTPEENMTKQQVIDYFVNLGFYELNTKYGFHTDKVTKNGNKLRVMTDLSPHSFRIEEKIGKRWVRVGGGYYNLCSINPDNGKLHIELKPWGRVYER